jgi:hypothetical protein
MHPENWHAVSVRLHLFDLSNLKRIAHQGHQAQSSTPTMTLDGRVRVYQIRRKGYIRKPEENRFRDRCPVDLTVAHFLVFVLWGGLIGFLAGFFGIGGGGLCRTLLILTCGCMGISPVLTPHYHSHSLSVIFLPP